MEKISKQIAQWPKITWCAYKAPFGIVISGKTQKEGILYGLDCGINKEEELEFAIACLPLRHLTMRKIRSMLHADLEK